MNKTPVWPATIHPHNPDANTSVTVKIPGDTYPMWDGMAKELGYDSFVAWVEDNLGDHAESIFRDALERMGLVD